MDFASLSTGGFSALWARPRQYLAHWDPGSPVVPVLADPGGDIGPAGDEGDGALDQGLATKGDFAGDGARVGLSRNRGRRDDQSQDQEPGRHGVSFLRVVSDVSRYSMARGHRSGWRKMVNSFPLLSITEY